MSRCSPEPSEEGWRQANETLDKLHAAERKLAEVERERDNLRFERNACEHNRRRDNEHLIGERDEARAEVERLREALRGPIHARIQTIRGMCTDEEPNTEIDLALAGLDQEVYAALGETEGDDDG